jgi:hypothetical protein
MSKCGGTELEKLLRVATLDRSLWEEWGDEGMVFGFRQKFALEDAIEFHAFAPLVALPCRPCVAFIALGRSLLLLG